MHFDEKRGIRASGCSFFHLTGQKAGSVVFVAYRSVDGGENAAQRGEIDVVINSDAERQIFHLIRVYV